MKTNNAQHKAFAFLGAAFVLLIALLFTACPNNAGGSTGSGTGSGGTTPQAPLVTGGASLILKPGTSTFRVKAVTADGTAVTVEGCTETNLAHYTETTLHAQGTTVILKGNITYLDCSGSSTGSTVTDNGVIALNVQGCTALQELSCNSNQLTSLDVQGLSNLKWLNCDTNQLTSLNVQGCPALNRLYCHNNKLSAQALTQILTDLPTRLPGDDAKCWLYAEASFQGISEGNHTDFTNPPTYRPPFKMQKPAKNGSCIKRIRVLIP